MGGDDKSLRELAGRSLLGHVIERLRPQVDILILNTGSADPRLESYGLEVVADVIEGFAGPLAGILTGLEWAARNRPPGNGPMPSHIATAPCDAPFVPTDLVARLVQALEGEGADIAHAVSGGRDHPVFALWPLSLTADLRHAVAEEGVRRLKQWTERHKVARVNYPATPTDPFHNINTPEDLAEAERLVLAGVRG